MNGYKLKRIRKNLTQYDVAKQTGIHQSRISLIENGYAKPNDDERAKLNLLFKPAIRAESQCNELTVE